MDVDVHTSQTENGRSKEEISPKSINHEHNGETKKLHSTKNASSQKRKQSKKNNQKESKEVDQTINGGKKEPVKESPAEVAPREGLNGNAEGKTAKNDEKTKEADQKEEEMEPLVLNSDEPDPELEFDENSDLESGKSSPVTRCKTRRSQTRNIPTPKTPRLKDEDQDSEKNSLAPTPDLIVDGDASHKSTPKTKDTLECTNDSIDVNVSTRAVAGSDTTRMNFELEESMGEAYLQTCKNRSLRGVSSRRSLRPIQDQILKTVLKNNMDQHGLKRKDRSETPEDRKKFKSDSTDGFLGKLTSPLSSFRNRFRSNIPSSTPKLTGYKDSENGTVCSEDQIEIESGLADKKNWCTIM